MMFSSSFTVVVVSLFVFIAVAGANNPVPAHYDGQGIRVNSASDLPGKQAAHYVDGPVGNNDGEKTHKAADWSHADTIDKSEVPRFPAAAHFPNAPRQGPHGNIYYWSRDAMKIVDIVEDLQFHNTSQRRNNVLFKGNLPLSLPEHGRKFMWWDMWYTMQKKVVTTDPKSFMIIISLLDGTKKADSTQNEAAHLKTLREYFRRYPRKGMVVNWNLKGIALGPYAQDSGFYPCWKGEVTYPCVDQLRNTLNEDKLEERVALMRDALDGVGGRGWLRKMIRLIRSDENPAHMTESQRVELESLAIHPDGAPPVVMYVHSEAGVNRVGELIGAYNMRHRKFDYNVAVADGGMAIPGHPMQPNFKNALQWWCFDVNRQDVESAVNQFPPKIGVFKWNIRELTKEEQYEADKLKAQGEEEELPPVIPKATENICVDMPLDRLPPDEDDDDDKKKKKKKKGKEEDSGGNWWDSMVDKAKSGVNGLKDAVDLA